MTKASETEVKDDTLSDIFTAGVDGFGSYRIPALLRTSKNRLLAFCEARSILSDHAQNKIVVKISEDDGQSWGAQILVADAGENALNNPLVVEDTKSGDIIIMYQEYPLTSADDVDDPEQWISHAGQNFPSNVHEGAVQDGYEGRICRSYVKRSQNQGQTWSEASEVTRQVKRPKEVTCYAGGPGSGIQLQTGIHKGRIVMPFTQGPWDNMKVYAVYSDDGGFKWQYGPTAPADIDAHANETQIAEMANGHILLNARSFKGNKRRKLCVSQNGGHSWSALTDAADLIEPECQASIIRFDAVNNETYLVYCGPEHQDERCNGTLKLSKDMAQTWIDAGSVYTGFFAYSSICQLNPSEIGVLFERDEYRCISFKKVSVAPIASSSI